MATDHIVVQGEYLSKIARKYGFSDYRTIWDHPKNATLKQTRKNPNVLFPGDRLFIPDREEKQEARVTDKRHRFQLKRPSLMLRIVVEDAFERPVSSAPFELHVGSEGQTLKSDGRGKVEQSIPETSELATLIIKTPATPVNEVPIAVKIGHLDPVEEVPGQKGRLKNLGYYAGAIDSKVDAEFRSAVEEFQCDHFPSPRRADGVPVAVDGVCGPKTQAKLKEVHGC